MMLHIEHLSAAIAAQKILDDISLNIESGSIHAIMGPNGSGKSTLANVLAGMRSDLVLSGRVDFLEQDVLSLSPEERAGLGIFLSFQNPIEIPGVSTLSFLKTACNHVRLYRKEPQLDAADFLKIAKNILKKLNMDEKFFYRSVNDGFSGGEKKRNEILQMLLLEPQLIILDELDSGLDVDALKSLSEVIQSYHNPHRAVILITHHLKILRHVRPDCVHILIKGRLVASGDFSLAERIEQEGYSWL